MAKIAYKEVSGNYEEDEQKAMKSEVVDVHYDSEEGQVTITVNIDTDDHYLTYVFPLQEFLSKIGEAVANADE